jgi:hypothetical protein
MIISKINDPKLHQSMLAVMCSVLEKASGGRYSGVPEILLKC